MKITRIETIPVEVPLKQGMTTKTAHGEHIVSPYVILRVHTDEGLTGLGEATVAPRWSGETSASCKAAIRDLVDPALKGEDPADVNRLCGVMDEVVKLNPFTKAGVEMALWDLAGKRAGKPLYQLLGGKVRQEIPMKMVVGAFDVPTSVALAEKFLQWGVQCLKVKVGLDPGEDLERVRAVRALAGPEIRMSIDANCGWPPAVARRMLHLLEPLDILFAEQPMAPQFDDEAALIRTGTTIPIMADESVFTPHDAMQTALRRSADIISVYPGKNGGIGQTLGISHVAGAAGLRCHMGSNLELGIATAAMLHVAASVECVDSETYPGDLLGPLYHEGDMIETPLELGPVHAKVPEGPGLGVTLDEAQIEHWKDAS
ncbi:MAG: mandelate racemase/muconate lactonizing protein [Gemmatimonadetes bacterium]|nr:mandelate racemase/muconate lactonizing protein [Gemmatimonadota bacterium]